MPPRPCSTAALFKHVAWVLWHVGRLPGYRGRQSSRPGLRPLVTRTPQLSAQALGSTCCARGAAGRALCPFAEGPCASLAQGLAQGARSGRTLHLAPCVRTKSYVEPALRSYRRPTVRRERIPAAAGVLVSGAWVAAPATVFHGQSWFGDC